VTVAAPAGLALRIRGVIRRSARLVGVVCQDGRGRPVLIELGPGLAEGVRCGESVYLTEGEERFLVHDERRLPVVEVAGLEEE
jgi:hypothetical protein